MHSRGEGNAFLVHYMVTEAHLILADTGAWPEIAAAAVLVRLFTLDQPMLVGSLLKIVFASQWFEHGISKLSCIAEPMCVCEQCVCLYRSLCVHLVCMCAT